MIALDFWYVEKTGGVADNAAPWEDLTGVGLAAI
jgi:hypothetical protein